MKKLSLGLAVLALSILVSCGGKKEDDFSKSSAEETEAAIENANNEVVTPAEAVTETPVNVATGNLDEGKKLFEGKGTCMACHQPTTKVVGPSLHDIAKMYKDKNADMVKFLKGESEAIVDPAQFEVMKANFAITKQMSDEELKNIEAYIYSFL